MKKEDLIILIIGLLLLAGMLITIFFGGDKSMHGVGGRHEITPVGVAFHSTIPHHLLRPGTLRLQSI
jgi:hypothetical protein